MSRKRIGLVGYYGFGNYGDEYFKEVLEAAFPDFELVVLHGHAPEGGLDFSQLDERISSVDAILIGGGDLVIPYAWSSLYWRDEYLRKPVFIYGVGVPRWGGYNVDVVKRMRVFFQSPAVRGIVARDQESADWITKHLMPIVRVGREPDIVCAFQAPPVERVKGRVGLILRAQGSGLSAQRIRWMADRVAATGHVPRLLVLATDRTAADDLASLATLGWGDADIILRDDLAKLTHELVSCEKVVSMKFHGCVVALAHGVPCLAMSGANKFKNFYQELELADWITNLGAEDFEARFEAFLAGTSEYTFPAAIREAARTGLDGLRAELAAVPAGLRVEEGELEP